MSKQFKPKRTRAFQNVFKSTVIEAKAVTFDEKARTICVTPHDHSRLALRGPMTIHMADVNSILKDADGDFEVTYTERFTVFDVVLDKPPQLMFGHFYLIDDGKQKIYAPQGRVSLIPVS
jgi:hypothetical protein